MTSRRSEWKNSPGPTERRSRSGHRPPPCPSSPRDRLPRPAARVGARRPGRPSRSPCSSSSTSPGIPRRSTWDRRARRRTTRSCAPPSGSTARCPSSTGTSSARAVQGDFGRSLRHRQPTLPLVLERFPATADARAGRHRAGGRSSPCRSASWPPCGAARSSTPGRWRSRWPGQCMPTFWLGILLILAFAVNLRWVPVYGGEGWLTLVLPAVTLGVWAMARTARITRSSMLEVLNQDFLRTARAKGIGEWSVDPAARAPQRRDPDRDRHRARAREPPGRRGDHRGGLRLSRASAGWPWRRSSTRTCR